MAVFLYPFHMVRGGDMVRPKFFSHRFELHRKRSGGKHLTEKSPIENTQLIDNYLTFSMFYIPNICY